MDLWRWAPVPSDLPISAGSSTSVNALNDQQQLAVSTCIGLSPKPYYFPPIFHMGKENI